MWRSAKGKNGRLETKKPEKETVTDDSDVRDKSTNKFQTQTTLQTVLRGNHLGDSTTRKSAILSS